MEQRLGVVTLGVADVARARDFYEQLGWRPGGPTSAEIVFFQLPGLVLALHGRHALAEDAQLAPGTDGGFGGIALAFCTRSRDEVDAVLAEATGAGGRLLKPAQEVFWGGYSGYFADPDGHPWEVAWNPFFPIDEAGAVRLPD